MNVKVVILRWVISWHQKFFCLNLTYNDRSHRPNNFKFFPFSLFKKNMVQPIQNHWTPFPIGSTLIHYSCGLCHGPTIFSLGRYVVVAWQPHNSWARSLFLSIFGAQSRFGCQTVSHSLKAQPKWISQKPYSIPTPSRLLELRSQVDRYEKSMASPPPSPPQQQLSFSAQTNPYPPPPGNFYAIIFFSLFLVMSSSGHKLLSSPSVSFPASLAPSFLA